jgi:hypothetical protein
MSVIALNGNGLTATDVSVLTALSYRLSAEGIAGVCVPAMMDDGQRMVAILNPDNEAVLFGFGKNQRGYFVFDWDGWPLVEACSSIDEILTVFK